MLALDYHVWLGCCPISDVPNVDASIAARSEHLEVVFVLGCEEIPAEAFEIVWREILEVIQNVAPCFGRYRVMANGISCFTFPGAKVRHLG